MRRNEYNLGCRALGGGNWALERAAPLRHSQSNFQIPSCRPDSCKDLQCPVELGSQERVLSFLPLGWDDERRFLLLQPLDVAGYSSPVHSGFSVSLEGDIFPVCAQTSS